MNDRYEIPLPPAIQTNCCSILFSIFENDKQSVALSVVKRDSKSETKTTPERLSKHSSSWRGWWEPHMDTASLQRSRAEVIKMCVIKDLFMTPP